MTNTALRTLQITVNGQARSAYGSVLDLITELTLDTRQIAIERNLALVPRSAYATTPLMDGDQIEIVGFIGGG